MLAIFLLQYVIILYTLCYLVFKAAKYHETCNFSTRCNAYTAVGSIFFLNQGFLMIIKVDFPYN